MTSHPNRKINSWTRFTKEIRSLGCGHQLKRLGDFDMPILVAGCQRSGTTMLERIISSHGAIEDHGSSKDEELDAALILSGCAAFESDRRVCFQTTYLDNCYTEYFDHTGKFKLVWLVRRPESVVCSMVYNWRGSALNMLFDATGSELLQGHSAWLYRKFGPMFISKLRKACLSYNMKSSQAIELKERLGTENVFFVEYDSLVSDPESQLREIFMFVGLEFDEDFTSRVSPGNTRKSDRLSERESRFIDIVCGPVYNKVCEIVL